jgi:Flp pilus assembly protein TadG
VSLSKRRQRGQVLALVAVLLPAMVLGVGAIVDTALVFKGRREALAIADAAAQYGAAQINQQAARSNPTQPAVIAVSTAESEARQYVLQHEPSAGVSVRATPRQIEVNVTLQVSTIIWHLPGQSGVTVHAAADAQPFAGVATGQAP